MRSRMRMMAAPALLTVLGALAAPAEAPATAWIDPFLERLRVGELREPSSLSLVQGWPADLFAPGAPDSGWASAVAPLFAGSARMDGELDAWRFLAPALGAPSGWAIWLETRRDRARALLNQAPAPASMLRDARGWLIKDLLYKNSIYYYHAGTYDSCHAVVSAILDRADELGLGAEERFVWRLRRLCLSQLLAPVAGVADEQPWRELEQLNPYDGQSAWAIWSARRRALGLPTLPDGWRDVDLARWLLRVRETWLTEEDLERTALPEEALAALGAVALPAGDALRRHFARHPAPPADSAFQDAWLSGRRRLDERATEATESWAGDSRLRPLARARLWRRAAEDRLLAGQWGAARHALRQGFLQAADAEGMGAVRRQLLIQAHQGAVRAAALRNTAQADSFLAMVPSLLSAEEREAWRQRTAPLRRRLAGEPTAPEGSGSSLGQAAHKVRHGWAAPMVVGRTPPPAALDGPDYSQALWRLWARWGLALAGAPARRGVLTAPDRAYLEALETIAAEVPAGARRAAACAAAGRWLGQDVLGERLLDWALELDLARVADGGWSAGPSPIPELPFSRHRAPWLARHAALAACLAGGDARGQIALAVHLPAAGLREEERLLFLYPLPTGPLAEAVSAAPVEPALMLAIARNESLFEPAIRSWAGALGWAQVMPLHWPQRGFVGGQPLWRRAPASLARGARLLAEESRRHGGDAYLATAAYNAGSTAVERWISQLGGRRDADLFLAWIGYGETREYVEKVLIDREIYGSILAGSFLAAP